MKDVHEAALDPPPVDWCKDFVSLVKESEEYDDCCTAAECLLLQKVPDVHDDSC